jgi:hypothetical protein
MEPLDTAQIRNDIIPEDWSEIPIYQNGQLVAWTQPNGDDTIVGIAPYFASLTSMPQMIIQNGIVQIFYSAVSIGYYTEEYNYRHIWGVFTEGDNQWSEQTDYTNDVFHLLSECVYPSLAPAVINNTYHIIYQEDNLPGNSLQPNGNPTHSPIENDMVYLPLSPLPVNVEETPRSTSFEVSQNYPNPAGATTYFTIELNQGANISVEVYSATGQLVFSNNYGYKPAGKHIFTLNTENYIPGVYFYTVSNGSNKVTRKMIIQ